MAVKMTAYEWLTSDSAPAVAWRKEATMDAWNQVYERAEREGEHTPHWFKQPVSPIERPATGREVIKGKFFTVPVSTPQATAGKFFIIPTNDGGI
jgi:hypothetical protein